ncbi:MAG: hypothetical protein ACI4U9_03920 [Clostridia bacterium]
MEKIIEELNKKYGISKNIINLMLQDTMAKGYNLEESQKILYNFLDERYLRNKK